MQRKKIKKKRSKYCKIDLHDFWKALYHGGVAIALPLSDMLLDIVFKTATPSILDWRTLAGVFIGAFIGSIMKSGATNSDGEIFRKDKYADL